MSEMAWRILALLLEQADRRGIANIYLAGWTIGKALGGGAASIQGAHVLHGARQHMNEYEQAMRELVDLGLVEEMPDLGERWRLVVKGESKDE